MDARPQVTFSCVALSLWPQFLPVLCKSVCLQRAHRQHRVAIVYGSITPEGASREMSNVLTFSNICKGRFASPPGFAYRYRSTFRSSLRAEPDLVFVFLSRKER
uniref:Putative secreted protein n=1 Tax=Anopheles triannulatus TaxID=58253 RepID=A0A2M4B7F9_9DIPT